MDVVLCPIVNTEYATGTAGFKAIRTTETSPVTYRARYYSKNTQYRFGRFASIADAADAIQAADSWIHDGQSTWLSDHLVSPFCFDKADGETLKPNQSFTTGQGRPDNAVASTQL